MLAEEFCHCVAQACELRIFVEHPFVARVVDAPDGAGHPELRLRQERVDEVGLVVSCRGDDDVALVDLRLGEGRELAGVREQPLGLGNLRHAQILAPKFSAVLDALEAEIAPLGIASWTKPKGGYFVSLDAMPGTAKRVVSLMKQAGVTLTGAGATYPLGIDPLDSNIRIAPTLPPVSELKLAMEILCVCLKIAALEKMGV